MMAVHSQYQIVPLPKPREIYIGVIDDLVCAYRSRYVHIPRTTYGSDFSPKFFGNLHRKCADATRRALNENFVARLNPSPVAKTLERRNCRDGYCGCVLKRQVGWLRCQSLFRCAYVLGKALALESCYPEDLVACVKLGHVSATRLHSAGDITTDDRVFGLGAQSRDPVPRCALQHKKVQGVYRCRAKLDQDLIAGGARGWHLRELQHIGRPVVGTYNRFHRVFFEIASSSAPCACYTAGLRKYRTIRAGANCVAIPMNAK